MKRLLSPTVVIFGLIVLTCMGTVGAMLSLLGFGILVGIIISAERKAT